VIVPVYNSERIVASLCEELEAALTGISHEIILVNDLSTDGSWARIIEQADRNANVKGVGLRINCGQDRAIMAGLNCAKGSYIVIMDDDLQHSPKDIPLLLEAIQKGYDVVYANFRERKHSTYKRLLSWGAGKVAEGVLRKPSQLYLSPFKILNREIVNLIKEYRGPFPYIDGLVLQVTSRIEQILVEHHPRLEGRSTHNFWKQANVFLTLATNFSILPLRLVLLVGTLCAGLSFILALYFLGKYFISGIEVVGWTALMVVNLFIGGVVMMSIGVLGEYVGRVLINVNQVPQYVIAETINVDLPQSPARVF